MNLLFVLLAFQEQFIIPIITLIGSVIFGIICWKSSHSGSVTYNQDGSKTESSKNKLNVGYLVFSLILLVATIVIYFMMKSDK